jgi:hypothetical protein
MEVDDIISYHDMVTAEKASLQKGMNYGVGKDYSVFLMSLRENAPYADALDPITGMLTYKGHDEPQRRTFAIEPVSSELMLGGTEIPKEPSDRFQDAQQFNKLERLCANPRSFNMTSS